MAWDRLMSFIGGNAGPWKILRTAAVAGLPLPEDTRLEIRAGDAGARPLNGWMLRGFASNERYTTRPEKDGLIAAQPPLGRNEATRAALIPVKKSTAWWALTQDERRAIFEERSSHIALGMKFLPAVARRLHHSRDLGEPFDFVTWFEYAPENAEAFDEMTAAFRRTEEWKYVEREVDVRLALEK